MLPGVILWNIKVNSDERGFLSELLRADWKDLVKEDIVQINISFSYPTTIRAWHRHLQGQVDYLAVLIGATKVCIYDENSGELDEISLTSHDSQVLRIPGIYWHGFKVVGNEPAWMLYFLSKLYDYENPDEERKPWNDRTIIPKRINGGEDDPRCNKPWNWLAPPHK